MSQELRARILLYLEHHSRTDSAQYVDDTVLADATGAAVEEVKRQLDLLADQDLVECANTFDSHSAIISPRGMLFVEELLGSMSEPEQRRIGFEP